MYCFLFLAPLIKGNNVIVFENNGEAVVQITRSGPLNSAILIQVTTVDGTAIGIVCDIQVNIVYTFIYSWCRLCKSVTSI